MSGGIAGLVVSFENRGEYSVIVALNLSNLRVFYHLREHPRSHLRPGGGLRDIAIDPLFRKLVDVDTPTTLDVSLMATASHEDRIFQINQFPGSSCLELSSI